MIKNLFKKLKLLPITILAISVTFIYNVLIRHILNGVIGVFKTFKKLKLDKSYFNTKEKKKTFEYNTKYDGLLIITISITSIVVFILMSVGVLLLSHYLLYLSLFTVILLYIIYMEIETMDKKHIKYYGFKNNSLNYDYKTFSNKCEIDFYKKYELTIGDNVITSFEKIHKGYDIICKTNDLKCKIKKIDKYGFIYLKINQDIDDTYLRSNDDIRPYLYVHSSIKLSIYSDDVYFIKEDTYDRFEKWE